MQFISFLLYSLLPYEFFTILGFVPLQFLYHLLSVSFFSLLFCQAPPTLPFPLLQYLPALRV
jgi:hypothetical protein